MIHRSIIICLVLLIGYSLYIKQYNGKKFDGQNQFQKNNIAAQRYIYDVKPYEKEVIVGSSLASRIVMDSLPNSFYNLSFGGNSSLDGLRLIWLSKVMPKSVFIETNIIFRKEESFADDLLRQHIYYPKKFFPLLREENQPSNLIGGKLDETIGYHVIGSINNLIVNPAIRKMQPTVVEHPKNESPKKKLAHEQVDQFSKIPDSLYARRIMVEVRRLVMFLREQNVEVVFFEMPLDPELENSNLMNFVRKSFATYFPPTEFRYLPKPIYKSYSTTDGIHLPHEEALRFTKLLKAFQGEKITKHDGYKSN